MNAQKPSKPKRQRKKNRSRTEVVSSDSDNDSNTLPTTQAAKAKDASLTDAEVSSAFTKIYMQRATVEFSEDLDKIRGADDFKDDALEILIGALKQGTSVFKEEEKRRVVTAGPEGGK